MKNARPKPGVVASCVGLGNHLGIAPSRLRRSSMPSKPPAWCSCPRTATSQGWPFGRGDAIDRWLAYGAALNEGRALFASDEQFGQWMQAVVSDNLSVAANDHERAAAIWGAANPSEFEQARSAGNARTVRGIHSRWQTPCRLGMFTQCFRDVDHAGRSCGSQPLAVDNLSRLRADGRGGVRALVDQHGVGYLLV